MDKIVLGGSDGAIEAVAMTAALNGAKVTFGTILLAGFAFAIAGGFSMFFSSYLSSRAEMESLRIDVQRERMEIETEPEEEKAELEELLRKDGYKQNEVDVIMGRLVKDKEMWLRTQLRHELRLNIEDLATDPLVRPGSAGLAFFLLALLALSPYGLRLEHFEALVASVALSLCALFALSSRVFTPSHFKPKAGLESALVGLLAAGLLYGVGYLISAL
ncbi:MAG: VIT1/CCC1 transporter family protein [Thaumarchaeota archaeon]|nr:VIT1/CCC1 transporter family protein [Nitrososphaerota archaeon]